MTKRTIYAADLFCGAGGSSTGLVQACEEMDMELELVAINHWERAVETHAANHPHAKHLCAGLDEVDPSRVVTGRRLDLLVASPECTHHSAARGGKPKDTQSRASAWHVLHWCERLRVENVIVENVPEFEGWGPLDDNGKVIKERKGETFQAWAAALRSLGYEVSWKVLNCADHGDPTTRRRLFVTATRHHGKAWPLASHFGPKVEGLEGQVPWRAAKEIIDWDLIGKSIFGRKKPLAENTLRRIAAGLERYGGSAAEPFLIALRGSSDAHIKSSVKDLSQPVPTLTASGTHLGLVEPMIMPQGGGGTLRPASQPLSTIATKGAIQLVEPFLVPRYGERPTQAPRTHSINAPMPPVPGTNQHHLCEPFLVRYNGTAIGQPLDRPITTLDGKQRHGLVEPTGVAAGDMVAIDIRLRMLQPHELSAAMSFPKDYEFSGTKTEQVKQIGNAVPVSTAKALCKAAVA